MKILSQLANNFDYCSTEDEIMFLYTLAGQTGMAIYDSQLYAQTKKQAEELAGC